MTEESTSSCLATCMVRKTFAHFTVLFESSIFLRFVSVRPWPSWFHRGLRLEGSRVQLPFCHPKETNRPSGPF